MSAQQRHAAMGIWRARKSHPQWDRAYAFYAVTALSIAVVAPLVRMLWLVTTETGGIALLTAESAPAAMSFFAAGLWAGSLLLGRIRGPALMPPFPLYVLTESGMRRSRVLRGPLLRAGLLVVMTLAGVAAFVGAALTSFGGASLGNTLGFVAAVASIGVVTVVAWLTGQVFPRAAGWLALGVLAFSPLGWVGGNYPIAESSSVLPLAGIVALALMLTAAVPWLLSRLTGMQLASQSRNWERSKMFSLTLEFGSATSVYATPPRFGRRIQAVSVRRRIAWTFLRRDAIGLIRTPTRALVAIGALSAGGTMLALCFLPGTSALALAGAAGLVIFAASAPLTHGLAHAAQVAGDSPLYGINDRSLVLVHAAFPLSTIALVLSAVAVVVPLAVGVTSAVALAGAALTSVLTLALRLSSALRGPLPPALLAPITTPVGDLSIVLQLVWAFGEALLAVLCATAVVLLPTTPVPLLLCIAATAVLLCVRWRNR